MSTDELRTEDAATKPHRIRFIGPGFLSVTIGTASLPECRKAAPEMARREKRDRGIRWVSWDIYAAK